jgi:hypothetical protein
MSKQDPAGVKALLDQLRASQAWQRLSTAKEENVSLSIVDEVRPIEMREDEGSSHVSSRISSLLSRLQSRNDKGDVTELIPPNAKTSPQLDPLSPAPNAAGIASHENNRPDNGLASKPSLARVKSARSLTFAQSLPVLGRLADDSDFLVKLKKVRPTELGFQRLITVAYFFRSVKNNYNWRKSCGKNDVI